MPFTDVCTDTGSGADDPHPAWVAGHSPSAFVDADDIATAACAGVEIIIVDPQSFNVDGRSTSGTSETETLLFWGSINHDRRLPLVVVEVCDIFGRADGRK